MLTSVSMAAAVLLLLVVSGPAATAPAPTIGLANCDTTCGNMSVPYPFGMGPARCYHSPGFNLTCDHRSGLLLLSGSGGALFEIVDISLRNGTLRVISNSHAVNTTTMYKGPAVRWGPSKDDGGPYGLPPWSDVENEFILTGCNVEATLSTPLGGEKKKTVVSACSSSCDDGFPFDGTNGRVCSGNGCCKASITIGSPSYQVWLRRLADDPQDYAVPVYALVAEKGWFDEERAMDLLQRHVEGRSGRRRTTPPPPMELAAVPVVLSSWALPYDAAPGRNVSGSTHSSCSDEYDGVKGDGYYKCLCNHCYDGNPYLAGGCQDIDECKRPQEFPCFGVCSNTHGSFDCRCPPGFKGNATVFNGCVKLLKPSKNTGLIIGLSVASGPCIFLLVLGGMFIHRMIRHNKTKRLKHKFFHQNRGQLLKKLVSRRSDIAERMIISLEELDKATNNFDEIRMLGGGGHGTVYKGILSDLHVVAIKKSNIVIQREIDEFINEVAILSQINHRNVVKLHGCCLETEVPLLAYEFISNGTLSDHLHQESPISIAWRDRLRIASEVGKAIAYLHSAVSVPIIHRDIKSSNILLDDALTAKVSDFGTSRHIPIDQIAMTSTAVQGTIGYLDPMYYYTGLLSEKSDVYSFGVLLIELLTRKMPITFRTSQGNWLVVHFVELLEEGRLADILDPQVLEEGGKEVSEVAALAASCIKLRGEERPTMRQVEITLEALQVLKDRDDNLVPETNKDNHTTMRYPASRRTTSLEEVSRRYSLEEEFLLSGRYPR